MRCVIRYIPGKDNIISDFISRNGINEEPLQILSVILDSVKFSSDELLAEQRNDSQIAAVLTYLTSGKEVQPAKALSQEYRQCLHKICITDGLLTYDHHGNLCVVAPRSLRNEILVMSHTEWSAGHFGVYKTHRKMLNNFWWPSMFKDVKDFVAECKVCLQIKPQKRKRAKLGKREFPIAPLELVSIDFLVDLPVTAKHNQHILVINDHFTKYIQLYAVKDRTAPTAAKCVVDYSLKFGLPYKLLSDQDPSFESLLFQCVMKELGVKKLRTTAYHAQSNGLTEQSNSTTKQYLASVIETDLKRKPEWDCWLNEAAFAYNTSVHSSTGFTSAELMFGRKFRVPIDLPYGKLTQNKDFMSFTQFTEKLELMYEIARRKMNARQDTYATYYDKKVLDDPLKVGDLVYVYL